jgi:hypothetical protein
MKIHRNITIDPKVWQDAGKKAKKESRSLSSLIEFLIKNWLRNEKSN